MELVDIQDLGSCGEIRVGSSPTARTRKKGQKSYTAKKVSDCKP